MARMTEQRKVIYDILAKEAWHPTVDEIFLEAKKSLPRISQATVYRNIEALIQDGLATKIVGLSGPARFEKTKAPHAHFECRKCGAVKDIFIDTECINSIIDDKIIQQCATETVVVKLIGLCQSCREKII